MSNKKSISFVCEKCAILKKSSVCQMVNTKIVASVWLRISVELPYVNNKNEIDICDEPEGSCLMLLLGPGKKPH